MEETIEIRLSSYKRLVDAEAKLYYLEVGGVDNWEGYDLAMDAYYSAKEEEQ